MVGIDTQRVRRNPEHLYNNRARDSRTVGENRDLNNVDRVDRRQENRGGVTSVFRSRPGARGELSAAPIAEARPVVAAYRTEQNGSSTGTTGINGQPDAERARRYDGFPKDFPNLSRRELDRLNWRQIDRELNELFPDGLNIDGEVSADEERRIKVMMLAWGKAQSNGIPHEVDLLIPSGREVLRLTVHAAKGGAANINVHETRGEPAVTRRFENVEGEPRRTRRQLIEHAKSEIYREFGVRVLGKNDPGGGDKDFTLEELNEIYHALTLLSDEEQAKLRARADDPKSGYVFRRSQIARDLDTNRRQPDTGARHISDPRVVDGERLNNPSITFFDLAFEDSGSFVGSEDQAHQGSVYTTTHEIAHALERRPLVDAMVNYNKALYRLDQTIEPLQSQAQAFNAALAELDRRTPELQSVLSSDVPNMPPAQRRQFMDAIRAYNQALGAVDGMYLATTPDELAVATQTFEAGMAAWQEAMANLDADHPARALLDQVNTQVSQVATSGRALAPVFQRRVEVAQARAEIDAQSGPGQFDPENANSAVKSRRLLAFERDVLAREEPVSNYGAESSSEAFAEAYAVYRSDPEFLRRHRPVAYQWFENRNHLN